MRTKGPVREEPSAAVVINSSKITKLAAMSCTT
jgi:hypothetical protein